MSFGKSYRPGPNNHRNQQNRDMSHTKKIFGNIGNATQAYLTALKKLKPIAHSQVSSAISKRATREQPLNDPKLQKYIDDYLSTFGEKSRETQIKSDKKLREKIDSLSLQLPNDKERIQKITNSHIPKVHMVPGTPGWTKFTKVLKSVQSRNTICMSIDIEAWEKNPSIVTEIGIAIWDPRIDEGRYSISGPTFENHHILIDQSLPLRNTQFMPDHKYQYLLGRTKIMDIKHCQIFIQNLIDNYMVTNIDQSKPTGYQRAFVGHGFSGDLKWLKTLQLRIPDDVPIFDTMKLFQSVYGSTGSGLGKALRLLQIPHSYLHNAGNDAYYTLRLLLHMCDIEKRKLLCLDDIERVQNTIENWRSHDSGGLSGSSKRRKKLASTEFQGAAPFDSMS
ncbi:unnamed protein product [Kluyveromyces dobzhanskii CBS 2104]|uniref:WGS project CCBQ000000000 data, contig MAT n=1 Tax=Kluyveromyces dobzhanskii CBS 2104 TaxID=1427455 RepID=A0A0A8L109_9SACH|nr:unnamed protein product [Kluyveromyces dobzhanskii CBS 2104]